MDRPYKTEHDDRQTYNRQNTAPSGSIAVQPDVDQDEVRRRAYARFEARGRVDGNDQADWFEAEREVRDHARTRGGGGSQPADLNPLSEQPITSGRATRRGFQGAPFDERNARANDTSSPSSPPGTGPQPRETAGAAMSGGDRVRDTGTWWKRIISDH